ncbi:MAG: HEAT repeat domain-containing protein, partial [Acidobacteriota bacterium]
ERLSAAKRLSGLALEIWTGDFDQSSAAVMTALDDPDPKVRQLAAVSLFQATWVIWGSLEVSEEKEAALKAASPKLRQLHPQLVERLDDEDPQVREYLLRALGTWMPSVPEGLSTTMVRAVDDPSAQVARLALRVLGRSGERSEEVVSKVLGALEEKPELRSTAADVLAQLYGEHTKSAGRAPASAEIIDGLSVAVGDPDERVQRAAIRALGRIGAGSESVRALLQTHADSETLGVEVERALQLLDAYAPIVEGEEDPS